MDGFNDGRSPAKKKPAYSNQSAMSDPHLYNDGGRSDDTEESNLGFPSVGEFTHSNVNIDVL